MQIFPIDVLIEACKNHFNATVREAYPGEVPDFVQDECADKLSTGGLVICKWEKFSYTLDPPAYLRAGVGYVIERGGSPPRSPA